MSDKPPRKFATYLKLLSLIPFLYLLFGFLWVVSTDWILFHSKSNLPYTRNISFSKGSLFVIITFALLFVFIKRITTRLSALNDNLVKLSLFDQLTGLYNRYVVIDRIEFLINSSARGPVSFGLIFIDIDNFKLANDSIGHNLGDELLKEFSARLTSSVRQTDTVSRFGGDEFLILLTNTSDDNAVKKVVSKINDSLDAVFLKEVGINLKVNASMGEARFPQDGNTLEKLLHHADQNMYRSKRTL